MELLDAFAFGDIISLVILAVILLVGLFVLRLVFQLTAAIFRAGCFIVILIVVGAAIIIFLNSGG